MRATDPEVIHIRHLHWAILFSRMPLNERREYLEDIKSKIYEFIRDSNLQHPDAHDRPVILPESRVYVGELTSKHVKDIQEAFKMLLFGLSEFALSVPVTIAAAAAPGATVSFYLGADSPVSRFFQSVVIHRDPVSQSVVSLHLHVVRSGLTSEMIRRCPRPECQNIFIRERKPQTGRVQYCSTACARAVANKNYLERVKKQKRRRPSRKK